MTGTRRLAPVALLFTGLAALMTWPQVLRLSTDATEHHDIYFNLWRLRWIAHALVSHPSRLFDGNIYYPEPRTLTFSDAILLEGLIGAPLLWAGVPPVLVHNLLLLGAMVGSGLALFVLARHLTGSTGAGIVGGIVFAFVPYRFEHYMHMEMQWVIFSPLAFWALHRTLETGALRFGLLTGAFIALQMLSCIYYGVFLITLFALLGPLLLSTRGRNVLRAIRPLAAGALLAGAVCAAYAIPYLATRQEVGGRVAGEVAMYSAQPTDYLVATGSSLLYGWYSAEMARPERVLFPGLTALVLAIVAVVVLRRRAAVWIYLLGLVLAFDMSLGLNGLIYPWLYEHVPLYGGLRAPARLGIFFALFLGVLAAFGCLAVEQAVRASRRSVVPVLVSGLLLLEYWGGPPPLVPFDNTPPPLYRALAMHPPGVIAHFPMPVPEGLPGPDPRYSYLSTFHWYPLVNGYSGYSPRSYLLRLDAMRAFPEERALARLQGEGVRYLVVHLSEYSTAEGGAVLEELIQRPEVRYLARYSDGRDTAVMFEIVQP